jgi:glycogen operon protein
MILMGDEARHTQGGNNNAYCQDNELSWFDWSLLKKHADVYRFVSTLCARRTTREIEHEKHRVSLSKMLQQAKHAWHGTELGKPDWGDSSHSIALEAELRQEKLRFYLILNAYWEALDFELPKLETGNSWQRWIDTALESPNDIVPWQAAPPVTAEKYHVEARSVVMLYTREAAAANPP